MSTDAALCLGIGIGLLIAAVCLWTWSLRFNPPRTWLRDHNEYDTPRLLEEYIALLDRGTHPPPPQPFDLSSTPNTKVVDFGRARRDRVH